MNYKQSEFKESVIRRCKANMADANVDPDTASMTLAIAWLLDALIDVLAEERITAKNGN